MEEVWVRSPTVDFISVSSFGRIRIDEYDAPLPNGGVRRVKTRPTLGTLKTYKNYSRYVFENRRCKSYKVHRLVAEAFLGPAPFEKAVVMHLDDNPLNNRVDNLKWGSQKENLNSEAFIAYCKSRTGENSPVIKGMRNKGY